MSAMGVTIKSDSGIAVKWSFEQLSSMPKERLLEILNSVPGRLKCKNLDADTVLPALVKLCASGHAKVKSAVCNVIVEVTLLSAGKGSDSYSDIGLLVVNVLSKDLHDANPAIRATAVCTICALPVLADGYALQAVNAGLNDSDPGVRKQAVIGCGKVWSHSPDVIADNGLLDKMYSMVRDPDPSVLTFALQTLNIILKKEGGVVINNHMLDFLLLRLVDCPEVEQVFLMNYIRLYRDGKIKSQVETCLKIMNSLDSFLDAKSGSLALSSIHLFSSCIVSIQDRKEVANVLRDFIARIKPQLSRFLNARGHANGGFKVAVLNFVEELPVDASVYLLKNLRDFEMKPKDEFEVVRAKLRTMSWMFRSVSTIKTDGCDDQMEILNHMCAELQSAGDVKVVSEVVKVLLEIDRYCHVSGGNMKNDAKRNVCLKVFEGFSKVLSSGQDAFHSTTVFCLLQRLHEECLRDHSVSEEIGEQFATQLCEGVVVALSVMVHQISETSADSVLRNFVMLAYKLLRFISNHPRLPMAPYYLEHVMELVLRGGEASSLLSRLVDDTVLREAIHEELFAAAFFVTKNQPASTQHSLAKVLLICKHENIPDLNERIRFWMQTLNSDAGNVNNVKK